MNVRKQGDLRWRAGVAQYSVSRMDGRGVRLPLAAAAAAASASAATFLLRPRGGLIDPAPVRATAYFSEGELRRARRFRRPQRAIALAGSAASAAALAGAALRPPPRLRRALERAAPRPIAGAAAYGAGMSLALAALGLPFAALAHRRSVRYGLSTQTWASWLSDVARSAAVGASLSAAGGALGMAALRRFPRRWWLPGAGGVVGLGALFAFAAPLVLDPIFNRFTPLPEGELRRDVLALAERAGVDVGEVFRVDASRRTTGANAYVWGLGRSKRVVLYDTLIDGFPADEVRSVVAHELSHVRHRDVRRGLAWLAIFAPGGIYLVEALAERIAREGAHDRGGRPLPGMLPALTLAVGLVSFAGQVVGNLLSRAVERRADAFALALTGDAEAFVALERRLVTRNIAEPEPPRLLHALLGTHPTALERIGIGVAFAAARGGAEPACATRAGDRTRPGTPGGS